MFKISVAGLGNTVRLVVLKFIFWILVIDFDSNIISKRLSPFDFGSEVILKLIFGFVL